MKQLNKRTKIKVLTAAIEKAKRSERENWDTGLCFTIVEVCEEDEIGFLDPYNSVYKPKSSRFIELFSAINRAMKGRAYITYKNHWGSRIKLLQRVLKQVEGA